MKKWCALLLTILMLFSSTIALGDNASTLGRTSTPLLLTSESFSTMTASEWYESDFNRALFTLLISFDLVLNNTIEGLDLGTSNSYVGTNGTLLFLAAKEGNNWVCISTDLKNYIFINPISCTSEAQVPELLSVNGATKYQRNSTVTIQQVSSALAAMQN